MRNNRRLNLISTINTAITLSDHADSIRRLIPVAWPVDQVEHTLEIQVEEKIGVVERYVIEALARFGQMELLELSDLLGIEPVVTEAVIQGLTRYSEAIIHDGDFLKVKSDALQRIQDGNWSEVVHRKDTFLVNGVNGKLLPIETLRKAPGWSWLRVDMAEGSVFDRTNNVLKKSCWVASSGSKGSGSLRYLIMNGTLAQRKEFGIPEGTIQLSDESPKTVRQRFILTIAEVNRDGKTLITPSWDPSQVLATLGDESWSDFSDFIRKGTTTTFGILDSNTDSRIEYDVREEWNSHLTYKAVDGNVQVSFSDPENIPICFPDSPTDDSGVSFPKSLWTVLRLPNWWNYKSFAVRKIVPIEEKSAQILILIRAMNELGRQADQSAGGDFQLDDWWEKFQEETTTGWPDSLRRFRVPLGDLLTEARKSTDTNVVKLASRYL